MGAPGGTNPIVGVFLSRRDHKSAFAYDAKAHELG
jgi:hypothetical protein